MTNVQVIVSGAGPVGLLTANLLGQCGINTLLVESRKSMYSYARAVGMDDETLRGLQIAGLYEKFRQYIQLNPTIEYLSPNGYTFFSPDASIRPYGYPVLSTFFQPKLESILREGLKRYPCVQFIEGCELIEFSQDRNAVSVQLNHNGQRIHEQASYLLACDGGKSHIRKKMGLSLSGDTQSHSWLVVDAEDSEKLRSQIQQKHAMTSQRPMVTISLPGGMRRFECMLTGKDKIDDDSDDLAISKLFSPFIGQLRLHVFRKKVYDRYYRYADTLQQQRIFLLGDAAHLLPPYGGQGLCSGIRDAINLCWKLSLAIAFDSSKLLTTYETERIYHMQHTVSFVKALAARVESSTASPTTFLKIFRYHSPVKGSIDTIQYKASKPPTFFENGFFLSTYKHAGHMMLAPSVYYKGRHPVVLDELYGFRFAIIGWQVDPLDHLTDDNQKLWAKIGTEFITVAPQNAVDASWQTLFTTDTQWETYFSQDERIIIVRPDKYIVGCCAPHMLNDLSHELITSFLDP
jgi:3-(3-hydroxy-phenyl)propionate hydroxylase